jgi:putative transposase
VSERRAATDYAVSAHAMSERRACRLTGLSRSTRRYRKRRTEPEGLRKRLIELATERPRFGYPRLHILLRREGFKVNRKRVYRLYRQEGLKIRVKRRRKFAALKRGRLAPPVKPNERWSLDFVSDTLADGRTLRVLTVVDDFTKLSPIVAIGVSLSSGHVIRALKQAIDLHGKPAMLVTDNGPEFTSKAFDAWCYASGIKLHTISPGKPTENAYVESFNGKLRDECLNQHHFTDLLDACELIEDWRSDYNDVRPHTSLAGLTPAEFVRRSTGGSPPVEPAVPGPSENPTPSESVTHPVGQP